MASEVWFSSFRTRGEEGNKINRLKKIMEIMNLSRILTKGDLTAIKLHFGERGNDAYLNPVFARQVVDKVKSEGAKPFLTDTNTLYLGSRKNAVDHLETALEHGYSYSTVRAPLIIADGLLSNNFIEVPIDGKYFKKIKMARDIAEADSMITLSHFKGHEMAGFGGALKNLAMGCAPSDGKKDQHAYIHPVIDAARCIGCGKCASYCPEQAIAVENGKAGLLSEADCIGCGECQTVCPVPCIVMGKNDSDLGDFVRRMTEYAYGAARQKNGKTAYINFVMNVTPECDCCCWSDSFLVPDVGIMASFDPVALDKACVDMVNAQQGNPGSMLREEFLAPGMDKFKGGIYSYVPWEIQLEYGEALGIGTQSYRIVEV
ncbi:MAG: DUF362 domain-containing protein [Synergistaceae bacterium]|nr:DUF362 domain-containing protein [Synergistaceae bacterium]